MTEKKCLVISDLRVAHKSLPLWRVSRLGRLLFWLAVLGLSLISVSKSRFVRNVQLVSVCIAFNYIHNTYKVGASQSLFCYKSFTSYITPLTLQLFVCSALLFITFHLKPIVGLEYAYLPLSVSKMDSRLPVAEKELGESARSSVLSPEKEFERSATSSFTGPPSIKEKDEDRGVQDVAEENSEEEDGEYPNGFALAMIVVALVLSIFLVCFSPSLLHQ